MAQRTFAERECAQIVGQDCILSGQVTNLSYLWVAAQSLARMSRPQQQAAMHVRGANSHVDPSFFVRGLPQRVSAVIVGRVFDVADSQAAKAAPLERVGRRHSTGDLAPLFQ